MTRKNDSHHRVTPPSHSRRGFVRTIPRSGFKVDLLRPDTGGDQLHCDGFDLGAYGLAFLLKPGKVDAFSPGQILTHVSFDLGGKTIEVDGKVRYVGPIKKNPQGHSHKVGIEFTRIDSNDVFYLCDFLVREAVEAPTYFKSLQVWKEPSVRKPKKKAGGKSKAKAKAKSKLKRKSPPPRRKARAKAVKRARR